MKFFIYYWNDRVASVIRAEAPEEGLNKLGFGGGAVAALDFYDCNNLGYYPSDKPKSWDNQAWVIREEFTRLELLPDASDEQQVEHLKAEFTRAIRTHKSVSIIRENQDMVTLSREAGEFYQIGHVGYFQVMYGEYCEGGWGDDDPNDHHYMGVRSIFVSLNDEANAIEAAVKYALKCPTANEIFEGAKTLEEIATELDIGFRISKPE